MILQVKKIKNVPVYMAIIILYLYNNYIPKLYYRLITIL